MIRPRGVYGVFDGPRKIYVGSSTLSLNRLEYNHRNWNKIGYDWTKFRGQLVKYGQNWQFMWLIDPYETTAVDIEMKEGILINLLQPMLNVDMDPVGSSIIRNRYTLEDVRNESPSYDLKVES
jgi:hypothetical protein